MLKTYYKILTVGLLVLLLFSGIGSSINITSNENTTFTVAESHLIEDVPYSYQSDYGCLYASFDMLFKYNGKNSSMMKNMFFNGVGYAYAFDVSIESVIKLPISNQPIEFNFYPSIVICQGGKDFQFLANLYGIKLNDTNHKSIVFNHFKAWKNWWEDVKSIIKDNQPVLTAIDPSAWPIYYELFNKTRPMPGRGGHVIVLVGFNESNKTICVQDSMAGAEKYYNPDRIGYQWIDMNDFKIAMARSHWDFSENSYCYMYVEDTFEAPIFDDAFRAAHDRNIERLKGNTEVYDDLFINYYKTFGINAMKSLRDKYKSPLIFLKYPFYRLLGKVTKILDKNAYPFAWCSGWIKKEGFALGDLADLLLELKPELTDENLTKICDFESELFTNISKELLELDVLLDKLQDGLYNNSIFKFSKIRNIKDEIVKKIDDIIKLQEQIIAGPTE